MIFVIGMRRCGTSYGLNVVSKLPSIHNTFFEPHMYQQAISFGNLPRIQMLGSYQSAIDEVEGAGLDSTAVKFALNPGHNACKWEWLGIRHPNAVYVFMERGPYDAYKSYHRVDSKGETFPVPERIHKYFWNRWYGPEGDFTRFVAKKPSRRVIVSLEDCRKDPVAAWKPVFDIVGEKVDDGVLRKMTK